MDNEDKKSILMLFNSPNPQKIRVTMVMDNDNYRILATTSVGGDAEESNP